MARCSRVEPFSLSLSPFFPCLPAAVCVGCSSLHSLASAGLAVNLLIICLDDKVSTARSIQMLTCKYVAEFSRVNQISSYFKHGMLVFRKIIYHRYHPSQHSPHRVVPLPDPRHRLTSPSDSSYDFVMPCPRRFCFSNTCVDVASSTRAARMSCWVHARFEHGRIFSRSGGIPQSRSGYRESQRALLLASNQAHHFPLEAV